VAKYVRNALTQMSMVSYIGDPEKREHLLQDAAARVSEVLFRIANSADLTGLSLEEAAGSQKREWPTPCGNRPLPPRTSSYSFRSSELSQSI
jgi:hypothetical protein